MRPIKRLIQLDEALSLALARTKPISRTEDLHLVESVGRVAAVDVFSTLSVPPFSRSSMDGYAVRAADTLGASRLKPISLRRKEILYAGVVPRKRVGRRECAEIATGAMLPEGADSTVMVEDTEVDDGEVKVFKPVHRGENVSKKGEDITPRTKVISKGDFLNPSKIGALAAIGHERIKVYTKPLVAVIPTGNEVADLGQDLRPGQVYNINGYTLSGAIQTNGGEARMSRIVNDSPEDIDKVIHANRDCDMLVFSGGSSVGERDIMIDVLEKSGEVVFHGVAIKPGKPTLFGVIGGQLLFGMPGYPTACLSNAYIILAPVLRKMARLPDVPPTTTYAKMASRVVSTTGRTQFLTVRIDGDIAYSAFKESGAITSMAFADGYVVIPADVDLIEKGETVRVFLL